MTSGLQAQPVLLLTVRGVAAALGISRASLYILARGDATFPRPVNVGITRGVARPRWHLHEIEKWAADRDRLEKWPTAQTMVENETE